jgi:Ca2+-binding EF-hand superfamily protein
MIPGMMSAFNSLTGKTNFRRTQALQQMNEGKLIDSSGSSSNVSGGGLFGGQFSSKLNEPRETTTTTTTTTSGSTKYRTDSTQPSWITNDRQVLRFFGYFKEKVEEKGKEIIRIRRIIMCYYLVDGSLSIFEPKIENSGLVQGELFKKNIFKKSNGGDKFEPKDFKIGGYFQLYSRIFYLVDCDQATRDFYLEKLHFQQQEALKYPDDLSTKMDEINCIKQSTIKIKPNKFEAMKKFQENMQKVLRFYISWQDPHPLYPEKRRYVLHYYLCDDTIEIIEPKEERTGRGHFAILLSRRKAKQEKKSNTPRTRTTTSTTSTTGEFITEKDLRCGEYLQLYSRIFYLEDCDAFTRDFYLEKHGITQEKMIPLAKSSSSSSSTKLLEKPKNTGITGKEDNLDKKLLRFRAKFIHLKKEDINFQREFILTFFLEDDTISIYEPPMKNSGYLGGKFLDRGKFKKCSSSTNTNNTMSGSSGSGSGSSSSNIGGKSASLYYQASDFYIGAVISFEFSPLQKMELIEADLQTLIFCENHPEQFIYSNIDLVLEKIARNFLMINNKQRVLLRVVFQRLDTKHTRLMSIEEFKQVLQRNQLLQGLNQQQIVTLSRRFLAVETKEEDGYQASSPSNQVVYDEFCDAIQSVLASSSSLAGSSSSSSSSIAKIKIAIPRLRHLLTRVDTEKDGLISLDELNQITSFHKVKLSSHELKELVTRFEHPQRRGQSQMDYQALCDYIFDGSEEEPDNHEHLYDGEQNDEDPFERPPHSGRSWDLSDFEEEPPASRRKNDACLTGHGGMEQHNFPAIKMASPMNFGDGGSSNSGGNISERRDGATKTAAPVGRTGPNDISSDPFNGYLSKINKSCGIFSAQRTASNALHSSTSPYASGSVAALNKPGNIHHLNLAASKPALPHQGFTNPSMDTTIINRSSTGSDQRVVDLLHRLFGTRKYQLRKTLRDHDRTKSGILSEEEFMDAILSLEPNLSDDDTYLIADVYFPKNDSTIDYSKLLESAFRT